MTKEDQEATEASITITHSIYKPGNADKIYRNIYDTQEALSTVHIDGHCHNPIQAKLIANSMTNLIPATESDMLLTEALPLSEADVKAAKQRRTFEKSLNFHRSLVASTAKTLQEITGARMRVAYRLCRYMTHLRGIGTMGEPCIYTLSSNNPAVNLFEIPFPFVPTSGWYRGLTTPRELLQEISESPYQYTYCVEKNIYTTKGMSVLPPPLHDGYYKKSPHIERLNRETPSGYDPTADVPLAFYLNIMEFLVRHLGIGQAKPKADQSTIDPDSQELPAWRHIADDRGAILALLNPKIARLAWPCRDDLEAFEEYLLVPYVEKLLVENSQIKAECIIKDELGLTQAEALDYVEVAKTYSREAHNFDPERERSIQISKLQALADRCNDAECVTTELNSYKTILQVLGLTSHEEDTNLDKRAAFKNALEQRIIEGETVEEDDTE